LWFTKISWFFEILSYGLRSAHEGKLENITLSAGYEFMGLLTPKNNENQTAKEITDVTVISQLHLLRAGCLRSMLHSI
jgi:hypothetical protein